MSDRAPLALGEPALSVVIPTLGRPTLHHQLHALRACRWTRPWEIVVADNSRDHLAAEICASWIDQLPSLRHVDASSRPGRSHAVNCGARHARAPHLLFLDDDDAACERIIERVGDSLLAGAHVVVFSLDVRSLNDTHVWGSCDHDELESRRPMFRSIPAVWGCAGIDKEIFLGLGGFDETFPYAEDLEFSLRLHQTTGIVPIWIPEQLLRYRLRSTWRERFHQRAQAQRAIMRLAASYPDIGAPPSRNRYTGLVADIVRALRQLGGLGRRERLATADQLGAAWGRFAGSGD